MYDILRKTGRTTRMINEAVRLAKEEGRRVCIVMRTGKERAALEVWLRRHEPEISHLIKVLPAGIVEVDLSLMQVKGAQASILADHSALEEHLESREPLAYGQLVRWNLSPVLPVDLMARSSELQALRTFVARMKELNDEWERFAALSQVRALLQAALYDLNEELREEAKPPDA